MTEIPIVQVDAFTQQPFKGNPAAVCDLRGRSALTPAQMQAIAMEMALSETAFLSTDPDGGTRLRWFTPSAEVKLCGHATVATAHALYEADGVTESTFQTLSGPVTATRSDDGLIELDFPAKHTVEAAPPEGLLAALGLDPAEVAFVGRNGMDVLVVLSNDKHLADLEPNLTGVASVEARGVIVTGIADAPTFAADFVSRFFAPRVGVPEDPVTGSAHCCLGPFWAQKLGRSVLRGYQASQRGGYVGVEVRGERVLLRGHAVTTMRGTLYLA